MFILWWIFFRPLTRHFLLSSSVDFVVLSFTYFNFFFDIIILKGFNIGHQIPLAGSQPPPPQATAHNPSLNTLSTQYNQLKTLHSRLTTQQNHSPAPLTTHQQHSPLSQQECKLVFPFFRVLRYHIPGTNSPPPVLTFLKCPGCEIRNERPSLLCTTYLLHL